LNRPLKFLLHQVYLITFLIYSNKLFLEEERIRDLPGQNPSVTRQSPPLNGPRRTSNPVQGILDLATNRFLYLLKIYFLIFFQSGTSTAYNSYSSKN